MGGGHDPFAGIIQIKFCRIISATSLPLFTFLLYDIEEARTRLRMGTGSCMILYLKSVPSGLDKTTTERLHGCWERAVLGECMISSMSNVSDQNLGES
jgi:hypothetical protein